MAYAVDAALTGLLVCRVDITRLLSVGIDILSARTRARLDGFKTALDRVQRRRAAGRRRAGESELAHRCLIWSGA